MKLSLRNRFLLPTLILTVLGMGALALLCGFVARGALLDNVDKQLRQARDLTDRSIAVYLKDRMGEVGTWSENSILVEALKDSDAVRQASASAFLEGCLKRVDYFGWVSMVRPDGTVIASSLHGVTGKVNVKDRDYFKESIEGKTFVSQPMAARSKGGILCFVLSVPVKEKDKVIGVLFGVLRMDVFGKTFTDPVKVGEEGVTFMFQPNGLVITHPDKSRIMKMNIKELGFDQQELGKGEGMIHYVLDGKKQIAAFRIFKDTGWGLVVSASEDELSAPIRRLGYINVIGVIGLGLLIAATIIIISNLTVKPIKEIARTVGAGADRVASAAEQLARASQQLAEGASEQAASIEETSSSLEEMASMTRQSAENAARANQLMTEASQVVENANGMVDGLTSSMAEISAASEETQKIIKTIDEIAFQTNLLALNAAVEAARAGEAGAGFAVVADEVRNLAMRAADAARNTAGLIKGTVMKVKEGSQLVARTNDEFSHAVISVKKSVELVEDIAAASKEQAQGIEQVNRAVSDMDQVTQRNSASAEESASASEEMNAQACQMNEVANRLVALIGGKESGKSLSVGKCHIQVAVSTPTSRRALEYSK